MYYYFKRNKNHCIFLRDTKAPHTLGIKSDSKGSAWLILDENYGNYFCDCCGDNWTFSEESEDKLNYIHGDLVYYIE